MIAKIAFKAFITNTVGALAALAFVLYAGFAQAVVTPTPIFLQAPKLGLQSFIEGTDSAGTYKTVYTGGANGSKCSALVASSTDASAAHLVTIRIQRGAANYDAVASSVGQSAGTLSGTPPLNLMAPGTWSGLPFDSDGNPFIYLQSGDLIQATFGSALTASSQINIIAVCADF